MRILCVCLGNICRSPTAEAVLRQMAGADFELDSAGTGNWHVGKPPYGPAIAAAASRGYDLSSLRARQFRSRDFDDFDLILAMDRQNLADLEALRPADNETPIRLIMDFAIDAAVNEVPDPYYTGDFDEALTLIESAAEGLMAKIG